MPPTVTVFIRSHDGLFNRTVAVDYFITLEKLLTMFQMSQRPVKIFYNKYGQVMPLSYQIPRSGLELYIDQPLVHPTLWSDILTVPTKHVNLATEKRTEFDRKVRVVKGSKPIAKTVKVEECLLSDSDI
jgi:hypothetical protein